MALSACAHVSRPSARDIESAEIHYDLGVNAVQYGRPQQAFQELREAIRLNPNLADAHNAMGLLQQWSYGRLTEARASFEKAVALRPDFADAWNNLGTLLAELGELDKARAAFDRALSDPLYRTPYVAQTNLGWVLHEQGDSARGGQLIRAALKAKPEYCMGHRQLARIAEAQGNVADAETSWLRFAEHCPDEPEALYRAALVHRAHGEDARAARALMRCVEVGGANQVVTDCRGMLSRLPPLPAEAAPGASRESDAPGASVRGAFDLGGH